MKYLILVGLLITPVFTSADEASQLDKEFQMLHRLSSKGMDEIANEWLCESKQSNRVKIL